MLVNHCTGRLLPCLFFLFVNWCVSSGLLHAQPFQETVFETPDYSVGLHTHQGYPADMGFMLDEELMKWRGVRADWAEADLDRLIQHANQFGAPLLSHGGISWRIQRQTLTATQVRREPLQIRVNTKEPLLAGEFLFHHQSAFRVEAVDADGLATLSLFQGASELPAPDVTLTRYRPVLHKDAAQSLKNLTVPRLIVQLVLLPPQDDPLPALFFPTAGKHAGLGLAAARQSKAAAPLFAHPRFQAPLLANQPTGKRADGRRLFTQNLFRNLVAQIVDAARTPDGHSKIAYWLLGNEPDSLIPVAPSAYLDWLTEFHHLLQEAQAPGELLLANLSGHNPNFDAWLSDLQTETAQRLADGRLDPNKRPFAGLAITHYLPFDHLDTERLQDVTARLQRRGRALSALFDSSRPLKWVAKEIAFSGQPRESRHWRDSIDKEHLRRDLKQRIRRYVHALKAMGYDDVVWFNQMPTGYGHGRLIDHVATVRETPLGRYLRNLNDPVAAPVIVTLKQRQNMLDFKLLFEETSLAFGGGRFTLWLEDQQGESFAQARGWLDGDTMQADGRFFLDGLPRPTAVRLQFDVNDDPNERFSWTFEPQHRSAPQAVGPRKTQEVNVPDRRLQEFLVGEYDQNGDGVLTTNEISHLQTLRWNLWNVTDLTGLGAFSGLQYLEITFHNNEDETLSWPDLNRLSLEGLGLRDIAMAETLTTPPSLETLRLVLCGNRFPVDVRASAGLKRLEMIDEKGSSRQPVMDVHALETLILTGVTIERLADFEHLSVAKELVLTRCVFPRDQARLGAMQLLGKAVIRDSAVTQLTADCRGLQELALIGNGLRREAFDTIVSLNDWDSLARLRLEREPLESIPDLSAFPVLEKVTLENCDLAGPVHLDVPPTLASLNLPGNQITELSFAGTTSLTDLNVSENELVHALNLRLCPKLLYLNVSQNQNLSHLEGLGYLSELQWLRFQNTRFRVFPDVASLPQLIRLFGMPNHFIDRCGEAELYLKDRKWTLGNGTSRSFPTTDLLCRSGTGSDGPTFADQGIRALSLVPQGNQWLLSWKGGTRRNFQPETTELDGAGAWTNLAGTHVESARRLALTDEQVTFQLTASAVEAEGETSRTTVDQRSFTLAKQDRPWTYLVPHVPQDLGWSLSLALTNTQTNPVAVTLEGVAPDGVVVHTKQFNLAAGQTQTTEIDQLLEPLPRSVFHWLRLHADGPLDAFQILGRRESQAQTRNRLLPAYAREGLVHLPPQADLWFAGLVFVNPDPQQTAELVISHFSDEGRLIDQQTLSLAPGRKWRVLADDAFALQSQASMVRWQANLPLREMALYGTRRPFTRLFSEWQTDATLSAGSLDGVGPDTELTFLNSNNHPVLIRLFQGDARTPERKVTLTPWGVKTLFVRDLFQNPGAAPLRFEADGLVAARALFFRNGKRGRHLVDVRAFQPSGVGHD